MDKHVFTATIFTLLIVSSICNASSIFYLRRLITAAPNNASTNLQVASPVGSPVSGPLDAAKSEGDKHKDSDIYNNKNNLSTTDSKGSDKNDNDINTNKNITGTMSPPDAMNKGEFNDKRKKEADSITETQLGGDSSCRGSLRSCKVKGMLACIVTSKNGSKAFLLVQNLGESDLKVNIDFLNSIGSGLPAVEVPKYQTKKINISSTTGKSSKIVLSSGTVNCVLDLDSSVYVENFLRQFSVYSRQVTPIYVASSFFLLALLCGGTWACCKLKKRSGHDGIPYQELEMGLPESTSAVHVEAAQGWDQDWDDDDDDWDEESAVRSPGGHKSISANGLSSRSSKKDGWDNDWDD